MARYRLLSFDGGGIRGYISSSVLKALDDATGNTLMQRVDGVCGTSTGGLISLGLSADMTPAQLVTLYRDKAGEIFSNEKESPLSLMEEEAARLLGLPDPRLLFRSKYTSIGLRRVLSTHLEDKRMSEASVDVVVNTARLWNDGVNPERWTAASASSLPHDSEYQGQKMIDLACATSAAPTYFPPHEVGPLGYFADGGVFANNPILNAIEKLRLGKRVNSLEDVEVVSLGTGLSPQGITPSAIGDPREWGILRWLYPFAKDGRPPMPLMSALSELTASSIHEVSAGLLDGQMVRIQPALKHPIVLDEHDAAAFKAMDEAIKEAVDSPEFDAACKMIEGWKDE